MGFFGIGILALSLSVDALGIGLSYGLRSIRIPISAKLIIALISMLFTELALKIGTYISGFLSLESSKLIGSIMLFLMGLLIIVQAFIKKEKNEEKCSKKKISSFSFKHIGLTIKIIRSPAMCDFDKSSHIDPFEALYLGTALSIDSFGAGIGSATTGLNSIFIPIAVGACQILLLSLGSFTGKRFLAFKKVPSNVFVVVSGVLVAALGLVRLFF